MPFPVILLITLLAGLGGFILAGPLDSFRPLWWLAVVFILTALGLLLRQRWVRPIGSLSIFVSYILCALFLGGFTLPDPNQPGIPNHYAPLEIRFPLFLAGIALLTWAYSTLWSRRSSAFLRTTQDEDERTNA